MNLREGAKIEAASIRTALFVAGRDGSKLTVPVLSRLIARGELFPIDGVHELMRDCAVSSTVDELTDTMPEQLVAGNMDLIATLGVV